MPEALRTSYHTHSRYCDGEGELEEVVEAAIAAGLEEIGLTSHAPLPFETEWNMPLSALPEYLATGRDLARRYQDQIRVLVGLEIDYIPGDAVRDFQQREILPLGVDYFVTSVHFLGADPPEEIDGSEEEFRRILQDTYRGDIRLTADDYYARVRQSVTLPGTRIIGHMDRIKRWNHGQQFFCEDEPWYLGMVAQTLDTIAQAHVLLEVNSSGWDKKLEAPFPSAPILRLAIEREIPLVVTSDSHRPADLTRDFDRAQALLAELGAEPLGTGALTA